VPFQELELFPLLWGVFELFYIYQQRNSPPFGEFFVRMIKSVQKSELKGQKLMSKEKSFKTSKFLPSIFNFGF